MAGVVAGCVLLLILIAVVVIRAFVVFPRAIKSINDSKLSERKKKVLWTVYVITIVIVVVLTVTMHALNSHKYAYWWEVALVFFIVFPIMMFAMMLIDKKWMFTKIKDKKKKRTAVIRTLLISTIMLLAGLCLWAWLLMKNGIIHF